MNPVTQAMTKVVKSAHGGWPELAILTIGTFHHFINIAIPDNYLNRKFAFPSRADKCGGMAGSGQQRVGQGKHRKLQNNIFIKVVPLCARRFYASASYPL